MIINRAAFLSFVNGLVAKSFDEVLKQQNAESIAVDSQADAALFAAELLDGLAAGLKEGVAEATQAHAN
jgi:hypothetical protein